MNLTKIGSNMTEVKMSGGLTVLFSYNTPVACRWTNGDTYQYYKTDKKWSNTTSKHISQWLGGDGAIFKGQDYFDNLIAKAA